MKKPDKKTLKSTLKRTLDIGEVSEYSGLPPSTLRYYEEKKLIWSSGRNGLRRYYDLQVLERLEFIALGRHAGFSLGEIAKMFSASGALQVDRKMLLDKANELERSIKKMLAVQETIRHVAHCPARNHFECPKFQRLLHLAGKTQARHPRSSKSG